jgi:hypothetical protein
MKKIILTLAMVSAISFTGCSSDDDEADVAANDCVTCAAYELSGIAVPAIEVCEGDNGNAFIQGIDTDVTYADYLSNQGFFTTCE